LNVGRGAPGVVPMQRLRQRAEFLAAATAAKVPTAAFVLQARKRDDGGPVRVERRFSFRSR